MREPWQEEADYREKLEEKFRGFQTCADCGEPLTEGGYHIHTKAVDLWLCRECMEANFTYDCAV
jgi:hypothetical protein